MNLNCPNLEQSLAWCEGKPVVPGVRKRLYYIAKKNIVSWPTKTDIRKAFYNANSSFVLAADACFKYIDILAEKTQVTSEAQGEKPSQTQKNKLVAPCPGIGANYSELAGILNNGEFIFIVQTMEGHYRIIGNEEFPVMCTISQDLGQGVAGAANTTINVEASDFTPAPFYGGNIVTDDNTTITCDLPSEVITPTGSFNISLTSSSGSQGKVKINNGTPGNTATASNLAYGSPVNIYAVAETGYAFQKWSDNNTSFARQMTVQGDIALTATFQAVSA